MHTVAGILIKGKQTYKVVTRNNWRQVTDSKGQECTNNPSPEAVCNNHEELDEPGFFGDKDQLNTAG